MKTVVVFRHVPFEDVGTLGDTLHECGFQYHYIDTPITSLATFDPLHADVLIVLGGPISANDETGYPFLRQELTIIRQRLAQQRPVLGICLGAQLMARALGARVAPLGVKEIGYGSIQLAPTPQAAVLAPLSNVPVLHWHGDRFEIPDSAIRLAGSVVCDNQAFSVGKHALGLQFHPEVSQTGLEGWLVGHACELELAGLSLGDLREQAAHHSASLALAAQQVMTRWLDQLDT